MKKSAGVRMWMLALPATLNAGCVHLAVPKTVVIYGDSIAAGGELMPEERPHAWVNQIEVNSRGTLKIVNEGQGGRPTDSLQEFQEMIQRYAGVDLLVIALGTNDSRDISGACVPNAVRNVKAMISLA